LYAKRDVILSSDFAAMAIGEATRQPWPALADVSPAGTPIDAGRPVLTVFAEGPSVDEVEKRLRERVATLENSLYAE
jgi:hypothetical protein